MPGRPKATTATVIPCIRYVDAPAAIEWLCAAFGFDRRLVVPGEAGTIAHAQLAFGNGMIMLGSVLQGEDGPTNPASEGDKSWAAAPYVVVADADEHCAGARAAGAKIVMEPEDQPYGGRLYACCDPEGHPWYFGTYDPWEDP